MVCLHISCHLKMRLGGAWGCMLGAWEGHMRGAWWGTREVLGGVQERGGGVREDVCFAVSACFNFVVLIFLWQVTYDL